MTIEEMSNEYAGIDEDKFANKSHAYDKYDIADAFTKGVEFAQKWISVEEELPKEGETVLIKVNNNITDSYIRTTIAFGVAKINPMTGSLWIQDKSYLAGYITHWRPINLI